MLRVRFPTGMTIQYNTASKVVYHAAQIARLSNEAGIWIADIPLTSGAIIESVPAWSVYQSCNDPDGTRLQSVLEDIHAIKTKLSKLSTADRKRREH